MWSNILMQIVKRLTYKNVSMLVMNLMKYKKGMLLDLLMNYEDLFQGKRGNWKGDEVSIKIKPGMKPFFAKPYPVPLINQESFKKEIDQQCEIGSIR